MLAKRFVATKDVFFGGKHVFVATRLSSLLNFFTLVTAPANDRKHSVNAGNRGSSDAPQGRESDSRLHWLFFAHASSVTVHYCKYASNSSIYFVASRTKTYQLSEHLLTLGSNDLLASTAYNCNYVELISSYVEIITRC